MLTLEARTADGRSQSFRVPDGQVVSIGRSSDNTVVLRDASVSRHHAELVPEGEHVILHDRGSFNGTFLDGRRILPSTPGPILERARLQIGRFELLLERADDPTATVVIDDTAPTTLSLDESVPTSPLDSTPELPVEVSTPEGAERLLHRLRVLERASITTEKPLPLERVHGRMLDLAIESVSAERGALFVADADLEPVCRAFAGDAALGKMRVSRTLLAKSLRDRECLLYPGRPIVDCPDPQPDEYSLMAVPLWGEECFKGVLYVESRRAHRVFDEEDLRVLYGIGRIAAARIENALLLEDHREMVRRDQELDAAAAVQRRLLPAEPMPITGYSCAATNVPCYEVGGDFYDYLDLGPDRHAIVLADVAGKGLAAAMLLMGVQAYVRAYVNLHGSAHGLVSFLNRGMLAYAPRNRFVSFFLAELDASSHRLTWFNAGHAPPPLLVRATGDVERLSPGGLALGILPDDGYPATDIEVQPGDVIVSCSDGVVDAACAKGEPFGDDRLLDLVRGLSGKSPHEMKESILDAVRRHTTDARQTDDLTVVALGRD